MSACGGQKPAILGASYWLNACARLALIYGWVLQFGIALLPFTARRLVLKEASPALGGCWGSLAAAGLGSVLVWASIFSEPQRGLLYGAGFGLYALALIHPARELLAIARAGLDRAEGDGLGPEQIDAA